MATFGMISISSVAALKHDDLSFLKIYQNLNVVDRIDDFFNNGISFLVAFIHSIDSNGVASSVGPIDLEVRFGPVRSEVCPLIFFFSELIFIELGDKVFNYSIFK